MPYIVQAGLKHDVPNQAEVPFHTEHVDALFNAQKNCYELRLLPADGGLFFEERQIILDAARYVLGGKFDDPAEYAVNRDVPGITIAHVTKDSSTEDIRIMESFTTAQLPITLTLGELSKPMVR